MVNKKLKITLGIFGVILAGFLLVSFGVLIIERDIKNKISKEELIIKNKELVSALPEDKALTRADAQCTKDGSDVGQYEKILDEQVREKESIMRAAEEIINAFSRKKLLDPSSYEKLAKKEGNEFFESNFSEGWEENSFMSQYSQNVSNTTKWRAKIMAGEIYFQEIGGKKIYRAPNYFNWSKDQLNEMQYGLCDGVGCFMPKIFEANKENIYWTILGSCSGGMKPEFVSSEEFYSQYKCEFFNEAIYEIVNEK